MFPSISPFIFKGADGKALMNCLERFISIKNKSFFPIDASTTAFILPGLSFAKALKFMAKFNATFELSVCNNKDDKCKNVLSINTFPCIFVIANPLFSCKAICFTFKRSMGEQNKRLLTPNDRREKAR